MSARSCQAIAIPGGPILVRGVDEVYDADGVAHPTERSVVAVCACGLTQRAPWCDGTHKIANTDS